MRAQYEALRQEALAAEPEGARGLGLALFLARGLPAWLAALTALQPVARPTPGLAGAPGGAPAPLLPAARRELTTVLASMVLACTQPREGGVWLPPVR